MSFPLSLSCFSAPYLPFKGQAAFSSSFPGSHMLLPPCRSMFFFFISLLILSLARNETPRFPSPLPFLPTVLVPKAFPSPSSSRFPRFSPLHGRLEVNPLGRSSEHARDRVLSCLGRGEHRLDGRVGSSSRSIPSGSGRAVLGEVGQVGDCEPKRKGRKWSEGVKGRKG